MFHVRTSVVEKLGGLQSPLPYPLTSNPVILPCQLLAAAWCPGGWQDLHNTWPDFWRIDTGNLHRVFVLSRQSNLVVPI